MINQILNFSVRQRMLVILAAIVLTGFGVLAFKQIPIDAFPDVTNVQVQVLATAGGMSPPEVEKLVTRPIEIQMGGLPRLEQIRSVSKIGLCAITIVFEDGVNDYFARQLVAERLQSVTTGRSGLGLLFLINGREGGTQKTVVSRFPAEQGVLAEEKGNSLTMANS